MPVRRPLPIATGATVALVVVGVAQGVLWYRLAPGQLSVVLPGGLAALPNESQHNFDAIALFVLMGLGAGLVSGTALWQWRSYRGPGVLILGVAASLLSAWVAYRCGLALTESPAALGPVRTLVTAPPLLGSAIVVVAQPLGAALAYVTAASFSQHEQLSSDTTAS